MTEILKKPFKLEAIFECISKTAKVPNFMKSDVYTDETTILATSSATTNNMLRYYVNEQEHNLLENCITVTMDGINAGYACYQKNKFAIAQISYALKLKNTDNDNKEVYLYLLSYLKKLTQKFNYTNKAIWNRYKEEIVNLPVKTLEDTEPDYDYMVKYMEKVKSDYIDSVINENNSKIRELKRYLENNPEINITKNPVKKEFKIGDLFEIEKSIGVNKDSLISGDAYDYITRTSQNRGILCTTEFIKNASLNKKYTYSLGLLQMDFFLRDRPWFSGGYVRSINTKKELNKNILLYLEVCLNKLKFNLLSHLIRDIDFEFLNSRINLPVKTLEDTEPDYDYMEKYMENIKRLVKIHEIESLQSEISQLVLVGK